MLSYETVEFLKDGSFKMASALSTDGNKRTTVIFIGTYALMKGFAAALPLARCALAAPA